MLRRQLRAASVLFHSKADRTQKEDMNGAASMLLDPYRSLTAGTWCHCLLRLCRSIRKKGPFVVATSCYSLTYSILQFDPKTTNDLFRKYEYCSVNRSSNLLLALSMSRSYVLMESGIFILHTYIPNNPKEDNKQSTNATMMITQHKPTQIIETCHHRRNSFWT